jgi:hypothetical protein
MTGTADDSAGRSDRADTVDALPRPAQAGLDRTGRQRRARRAALSAAGALVLLGAAGIIGWRVTAHRNSPPAAHSPRADAIVSPTALPAMSPAGGGAPAAQPSVSGSPAPALTAASVVIYTCQGKAVTEPTGYILACADGNGGLSALTWTSWTPASATASGQYYANTCVPDCADGTFTYTPVTVTLSEPLATPSGGEYYGLLVIPGHGTWQLGPQGPIY